MKIKEGFKGERSIVLPRMLTEMEASDALLSRLYVTDIGHYPNAAHHHRTRTEPIAEHVFIYCVDGSGHYRLNGKEHTVSANQFFILPPGVGHEYWSDEADPWTIYWMHFAGKMASSYADGLDTPHSIKPSRNSRIADRIDMFEEMMGCLSEWHDLESIRYCSSLLHHFLGSLRYLDSFRSQREESKDYVEAIKHFISENLERQLSLAEIAEYAGRSIPQISAVFKKRTGYTLINYVNMEKISRACRLLDETQLRLNQISPKVGIADPGYFSRLFSSIMGMSPSEYRDRPHG